MLCQPVTSRLFWPVSFTFCPITHACNRETEAYAYPYCAEYTDLFYLILFHSSF